MTDTLKKELQTKGYINYRELNRSVIDLRKSDYGKKEFLEEVRAMRELIVELLQKTQEEVCTVIIGNRLAFLQSLEDHRIIDKDNS